MESARKHSHGVAIWSGKFEGIRSQGPAILRIEYEALGGNAIETFPATSGKVSMVSFLLHRVNVAVDLAHSRPFPRILLNGALPLEMWPGRDN